MFSKILKILTYYLVFILLFTSLYIFLFHSPLFNFQNILFYRGIYLLTFLSLIFPILTLLLKLKYSKINLERFFNALFVSICFNLSFFIVFPVTFERSVTMFLLNNIKSENRYECKIQSTQDLEKNLIETYVIKNKAIEKRMEEQKVLDTVITQNNCVDLTKKGNDFLSFSGIVMRIYNIRK